MLRPGKKSGSRASSGVGEPAGDGGGGGYCTAARGEEPGWTRSRGCTQNWLQWISRQTQQRQRHGQELVAVWIAGGTSGSTARPCVAWRECGPAQMQGAET